LTSPETQKPFNKIEGKKSLDELRSLEELRKHIGECERCGHYEQLYPMPCFDEETNEETIRWICWDCDFELINGRGDWGTNISNILEDREERAYYEDPINNPPPRWMRRRLEP